MSFPIAIPSKDKHMVTLHKEGPLYILHMHNADNRFEGDFIAALNQALDIVERAYLSAEDLEDTALITIGNDKIYSNGLNLEHAMMDVTFMDKYLALLRRILTFPIPTVAAINGHAFAGGFMMAIAHDYRVMRSDRGFLCMNEVDLPAPLAPGMAAIIREKLAPHTYRNMILQGHRFNAKESLQEHIVDEIAENDKVLDTAKALALKWAPKAKSGVVYKQLKDEMYTNVVAKLSMPYHRLAPKM
ncbi:hypothetical protein VKS41_008100 [Umbelopsis sp. WA50703]